MRSARIPVFLAAMAALAGCSAAASAGTSAPASFHPAVSATHSASEPAWGRGWVGSVEDMRPVLRPDATANEALANRLAASGYGWTGKQATCLDELWMKVSSFDNFYANDLFNGIAGVAGHVTDPSLPADPTMKDLQAAGWFDARPDIQIAAGLVDIQVYWATPCAEWARDAPASVPAGTYPLDGASITDSGWRGQAGRLDFDVTGGRLALTPETLESVCGVPGEPAADPAPPCARITQATTWPMS
jgi:hypothetical protein